MYYAYADGINRWRYASLPQDGVTYVSGGAPIAPIAQPTCAIGVTNPC